MSAAVEAQPKIKLYWLEKSRAQSILWLLEELGLEYELELLRRDKKTMLAPAQLKMVHALGKSPVLELRPHGAPSSAKPVVLAETGFIAQYLCEHFGRGSRRLMPTRWRDGQEGRVGGETEQWMRWMYFLHYNEGSFMQLVMMSVITGILRSKMVPWLVRWLTTIIAKRIISIMIFPNCRAHLGFMEERLQTSGGKYVCGDELTAADIVLSFGFIMFKDEFKSLAKWRQPPEEQYPLVFAWIDRLAAEPGYKRSVAKIKEIDTSYGISFKL